MTDDRLREIRERREKLVLENVTCTYQNEDDGNFLVCAPADIDYLLGEVARLTERVDVLEYNEEQL